MPPEISMRCALTQWFASESSAAIAGPMSSGKPRRNRVDRDPTWSEFDGKIAGEYFDRAFHPRVRRGSREREARPRTAAASPAEDVLSESFE
jgi:hypothetical protein